MRALQSQGREAAGDTDWGQFPKQQGVRGEGSWHFSLPPALRAMMESTTAQVPGGDQTQRVALAFRVSSYGVAGRMGDGPMHWCSAWGT